MSKQSLISAMHAIDKQLLYNSSTEMIAQKVWVIRDFLAEKKCYPIKNITETEPIYINMSINRGSSGFLVLKPKTVKRTDIGVIVKQDPEVPLYFGEVKDDDVKFRSYDLTEHKNRRLEIFVHNTEFANNLVGCFKPGYLCLEKAILFSPSEKPTILQLSPEQEDELFKIARNKEYLIIKQKIGRKREVRVKEVETLVETLQTYLDQIGIDAKVTGRAKNFLKILSKTTQRGLKDYLSVKDLKGIRVHTSSLIDCYIVYGRLIDQAHNLGLTVKLGNFSNNMISFRDNISFPKLNGYQTLSSYFVGIDDDSDSEVVEVQIRTNHMDRIAQRGSAAGYHSRDPHYYTRVLGINHDALYKIIGSKPDIFPDISFLKG